MNWMKYDITFCNGIMKIKLNEEIEHKVQCPIRNTCHRFITKPKDDFNWWQEASYNFNTESCELYWKIDRKEKRTNIK